MPRPRRKEKFVCRHFNWLLGRRDEVWQADGRSNRPKVRRHSLGTDDYQDAKRLLAEFDLTKAVESSTVWLTPRPWRPSAATTSRATKGAGLYMDHVGRARVAGGVRESSRKRYRAVFDKFIVFARSKGLTTWDRITAQTLLAYAKHLEKKGHAYRTQYLELTTLKQTVLWLRKAGAPACRPPDRAPPRQARGDRHVLLARRQGPRHVAALPRCTRLGMAGRRDPGARNDGPADLRVGGPAVVGHRSRCDDHPACRRDALRAAGQSRSLENAQDRTGRIFPIQEELLPSLQDLTRHPDGLVFHSPRGGRIKPDMARRVLIRDVLKPLAARFPTPEGEVCFADRRLHSFGHDFCSLRANRGVPQRVVMRWLGHRESRMVEHYDHLHDDEARRQMGRIRLFDGRPAAAWPPASELSQRGLPGRHPARELIITF